MIKEDHALRLVVGMVEDVHEKREAGLPFVHPVVVFPGSLRPSI